ncbi:DUF6415 family natural product biosynthesis protein [Streptomyces sp. NPDC004111]|uniref:DUF6415 family natural product biosynthesis protein n=1 Tax=Streptomyces sp. NPDC004111 TaxID=3364690 RepID=UPI0036B89180
MKHFAAPNDTAARRLALDVAVMTDTVARAHQALASHPLPRPDEVALLTHLLSGHVRLLLEDVLPRLRAMDHGTTRWDQHKADYDAAHHALEAGPTHGLGAATIRLRDLTRGCERLLEILAAAGPEPGRAHRR